MNTPSTGITLDLLVEHLRAPFPLTEIKFLPKSPIQRDNAWVCLALPYADKRAYEDRLNALVPGRWSTPAMTPLVAGNKLVVPVTLVICEIAHTDVGEAFLTSLSRKGEPREEENAATEAYSQAFRRACAQFGLGRYLYDLPKAWVPYDPQKRSIALAEEELRQLAERLYRKVGLLPASPSANLHAAAISRPLPGQVQPASAHEIAESAADAALPQEPVQPSSPHKNEERPPAPATVPHAPSLSGAPRHAAPTTTNNPRHLQPPPHQPHKPSHATTARELAPQATSHHYHLHISLTGRLTPLSCVNSPRRLIYHHISLRYPYTGSPGHFTPL